MNRDQRRSKLFKKLKRLQRIKPEGNTLDVRKADPEANDLARQFFIDEGWIAVNDDGTETVTLKGQMNGLVQYNEETKEINAPPGQSMPATDDQMDDCVEKGYIVWCDKNGTPFPDQRNVPWDADYYITPKGMSAGVSYAPGYTPPQARSSEDGQ